MDIKNIKPRKILLSIAAGLAVAGLIYCYFWYESTYPSTDNAYTMAHVIKVSSEVDGKIIKIFVNDHQKIKKTAPILQIDPTSYFIAKEKARYNLNSTIQQLTLIQTEINTAKAKLDQYQANFANIEKQLKRLEKLLATQAISQANYDEFQTKYNIAKQQIMIGEHNLQQSENKYQNAKIQINAAQEELNQASLNLEHTLVKAPADGIIMNLNQRTGDFLAVGQPALSLIETDQWWVDANFKETQLANIKPGNRAKITLDIYPNQQFQGVVEAVSGGSGAVFSLLPPENAVGNWIKAIQRFTVKINIITNKSLPPLRMGASCRVIIDTRNTYIK